MDAISYSVEQAMELTSIGRSTMYDLMRRGEIGSVKVGRRRIIPAASLRAYIERLQAEQSGSAR